MNSILVRPVRSSVVLLAYAAALGGCPSPASQPDAATDANAEASTDAPVATLVRVHSLVPSPIRIAAGATGDVTLRLARDRVDDADYDVTVAPASVAMVPTTLRITAGQGSRAFRITGLTPGNATLTVTRHGSTNAVETTQANVVVTVTTVPECPAGTQAGLMPVAGSTVRAAASGPLAAVAAMWPMGYASGAQALTVACAPDAAVPSGFVAVGPAVTFGPQRAQFTREIPLSVPANPGLVPLGYELHTEVAWIPPGGSVPRIVPVANRHFSVDGNALEFETTRLGTFRAVVRPGLGTRTVRRHFTYRALLGVSMGALGSSMIGTNHPEMFDALIPLGGPADWGWFGDYFRRWHVGGFCTAEERARLGDTACARATNERSPVPEDLWVADQNFEFFNYPDGRQGQGGNFDRESYIQIYRDLASAFGNPLMQSDPADITLPKGIAASDATLPDAQRCAMTRTLQRYYDDEYNPDGSLPVITFCDGNHTRDHLGEWTGTPGNYPFSIGLAVDVNRNGRRDPGEPVIRNMYEPWEDTGVDGLPNAREAGYDAVNNPDPAGDDYDRVFNPGGTERNFVRESQEPFQDVGLDGMACPGMPRETACPYDMGEGNGTWDTAVGAGNFFSRNPRARFANMPAAQSDRLAIWSDGGTRDLFNFGAVANHFSSAVAQRGYNLAVFNNFTGLVTGRQINRLSDEGYVFTEVDWAKLPRHVLLRYGFDDASAGRLEDGDGGHVGTIEQITNRLYAGVFWTQAQWPDGDRTVQPLVARADDAGRCANGYNCTFDFHSDRANRTGPVSIYLPAGYHDPANRNRTYPVLYFLHGYGQEPNDLIASGLLIANYTINPALPDWERPAKFIMVFPDGRCRAGDGCTRGTFYADSPSASRAQMETYFLDLYDYVSRTYRARAAEDRDVSE